MKNTILSILLLGAIFSTGWIFRIHPMWERLPISFVKKERPSLNPNRSISICGGLPLNLPLPYIANDTQSLAPTLSGLGDLHFEVSTDNEAAQTFFNQGIRLVYAFNHAEAIRAFQEAARLDGSLAMAHWGEALAIGPNINDPFPDSTRQRLAYEAIVKAQSLSSSATVVEKALIEALSHRYSHDLTDQPSLNIAYFGAMEKVYDQFPDHPEVGTLYAAAIMNTMPWNYYDEKSKPKEHTLACTSALQKVIEHHPEHPGAHHYFIHIIEAHEPDQAIPSADVLASLMPGAGHIVHMPSHIYLAVGMYEKAAETNRKAILADENYIAQCQAQGTYPLAYYPHNLHFLWAATTMMGNEAEAIEAARKTAEKVPKALGNEVHFIQDFLAVPFQAYVRFGKWNEILTTPHPGKELLHTTMMWHYARGIAFTRKGQLDLAREELAAVHEIVDNPDTETLLAAYNNPTKNVGLIASTSLAGEIAAAEGKMKEAIELMNKAVEYESQLIYQEPAAWHAPVRHTLGALLIEMGQFEEAENVYKADLAIHKHNGWALFGLYQSLIAQHKVQEATLAREKFEKAWEHADIALTSTKF